jgi:hypothetical protein
LKPEANPPDAREMRVYPAISSLDVAEYERIRKAIIAALQKHGVYEPDIDELLICEIASDVIYFKKAENFLDSETASEYTFSRVVDAKLKLQKAVEAALRELALSRRDRLNQRGQSDFSKELREAILKAKKK